MVYVISEAILENVIAELDNQWYENLMDGMKRFSIGKKDSGESRLIVKLLIVSGKYG